MTTGFELFKKTRTYLSEEAVTISKSGALLLSPLLYEQHFKNNPYADLYFNSKAKKIGIKPLAKAGEFSYKLTLSSNKKTGVLSGRAFLKTYNIPFEVKRTYPTTFEEGMIIFSIEKSPKDKT